MLKQCEQEHLHDRRDVIRRSAPPADLSLLVEAFAARSAEVPRSFFPVFPTARAEVIFHFADPFLVADRELGPVRPLPGAVLLGPRSARYWQSAGPRIDWFLVQLTPLGCRRLLGVRFADSWHREFALTDFWGSTATALHSRLQEAGSFNERMAVASAALRALCRGGAVGDAAVSEAGRLARAGRMRSVDQLAARLDVGPRRLRQRFAEEYGISPKQFLRLMRFGRQLVSRHPLAARLHPPVDEPEYADDSHAIREFRRFTGMTPGAYTQLKSGGDQLIFTGRQTLLDD
jgi:AraC-like DNA-binding protein